MYSRRDQVQAHSFLTARLANAVLRVEPDAPLRPLRRTSAGVLGGLAVAGVVAVVIQVIGLLRPGGGDAWREPGALILDERTGSRFLLIDGRLRPVLNYASARLILGGDPNVVAVDTADLAGLAQGGPVGIMGAPDALPGPGGPPRSWTVCVTSTKDKPRTAVAVAAGDPRPAEPGAVLARAPDGALYLAWHDRRMRITAAWVPGALGLDPNAALPVSASWLNVLPSGPDLDAPAIDRGGRGPEVAGEPTIAGQLLEVAEAVVGPRFYLVQRSGLVPVTRTVAALALADPAAPAAPRTVPASALASVALLPKPDWQAALPPEPPALLALGGGVPCVRWEQDTATVLAGPAPAAGRGPATAGVTTDARTADRVDVRPGAGLLVRTRPAPGMPGAGVYLITDAGAKFPVASAAAADALGLPVDSATPVPADLIALLPTGPVLDRIT